MFPSVDPQDVGVTGLLWLLLTYGYVLFRASNLISEGSDLLLLVPSLAGLVGGVVLPLLGAVPDGAIMLFSGLGDKETAQETLSVGVGALAGSTIMLLTVPWALSVFAGRVDLKVRDGVTYAAYKSKPKLLGVPFFESLNTTGVAISNGVRFDAFIMLLTTIPYFLIQIPALFMHGPAEEVAKGEKYWALLGLIICVGSFIAYLVYHVKESSQDHDKLKRIAVVKEYLYNGKMSLAGALDDLVQTFDSPNNCDTDTQYMSIGDTGIAEPSPELKTYLVEILKDAFNKYDENKNNTLEKRELKIFLLDFHETISNDDLNELFAKYDTDGDGIIDFNEFVCACYTIIKIAQCGHSMPPSSALTRTLAVDRTLAMSFIDNLSEEEDEEEEIPEEIAALPPHEQQKAIKKKAFSMLTIGTLLVLVFSDPMVDVMQEIAVRIHMSPFYVSFILAPLASNASEVLASQFYAAKKTRKTIDVAFSALEGAASMNNTFCLAIFMGLIFFRELAWQYTAETISIVLVQAIMFVMTRRSIMTAGHGLIILAIFPLSIAFVAGLEALGLD